MRFEDHFPYSIKLVQQGFLLAVLGAYNKILFQLPKWCEVMLEPNSCRKISTLGTVV